MLRGLRLRPLLLPRSALAEPAAVAIPARTADLATAAYVPASAEVPENVGVSANPSADVPVAAPMPQSEDRLLPAVQEEAQPALLSEAAGIQVARSFEELAAACDGSPRRSLDEIAQEMLRPMLQEWLDLLGQLP